MIRKDSKLLYVVGVGRSGTSLLQSMLNAHSDIAFFPEIHFYKDYITNKKNKMKFDAMSREFFLNHLSQNDSFIRANIDVGQLKKIDCSEGTVLTVYSELVEYLREKTGKRIIGEKDPKLLEVVDVVKKYTPEAKIIHIIRDPRDVICSKMKASWSSGKGFILNTLLSQAQLAFGAKLSRNMAGCLEIKYEDLISDPEKVLKQVCCFVEVDYSKDMLDYVSSSKELVSENEYQWKANTLKPILKGNMEKWRSEITTFQVAIVEKICSQAFGGSYQSSFAIERCSLLQKLIVSVIGIISQVFTKTYPLMRGFL